MSGRAGRSCRLELEHPKLPVRNARVAALQALLRLLRVPLGVLWVRTFGFTMAGAAPARERSG